MSNEQTQTRRLSPYRNAMFMVTDADKIADEAKRVADEYHPADRQWFIDNVRSELASLSREYRDAEEQRSGSGGGSEG